MEPASSFLRRLAPLALVLLLAAALGPPGLRADEAEDEDPPAAEIPRLEAHPLADAKPGEFLRYREKGANWSNWYVERVLDVREGEILFEVMQTNEEGTKDIGAHLGTRNGWRPIPRLQPTEHQRIVRDKMVILEIAGQPLRCRHFVVDQPQNPPWPEPRMRREVWYTNDVPCSGKVKESNTGREALAWGMMGEEERARRRKAYDPPKKADDAGKQEPGEEKPPEEGSGGSGDPD